MPQTGPGPARRRRDLIRVRNELAREAHSAVRGALGPGAQGPVCGEQETSRAWLPAPLVWTWVRAYRQQHAGNAGLRPATTSLPSCPRATELDFRSTQAGAKGCAHARCALLSFSCQSKKGRKLCYRFLDNVPETKHAPRSAQQRICGESVRVFPVAFCTKLRRARSA